MSHDLAYPDGVVLHGDCRVRLGELPAESVQCVVTSPPYYGLRRYAGLPDSVWGGDKACKHEWITQERYVNNRHAHALAEGLDGADGVGNYANPKNWNIASNYCHQCHAWLGQLGNEPTVALYLAHLVEVFDAVRRVLRRDGVCWVNLGDSYSANNYGSTSSGSLNGSRPNPTYEGGSGNGRSGIASKNLLLIPERFAIAMQEAGWYVRSRIVWAKKSSMPESVTDRPTSAHETIWMLTKSPTYFYDSEAVKQPAIHEGRLVKAYGENAKNLDGATDVNDRRTAAGFAKHDTLITAANLRNTWLDVLSDAPLDDLWHLGPEPYAAAHFATFPTAIPRRCILASTSEKGACAACGAPWRRVTDSKIIYHQKTLNAGKFADSNSLDLAHDLQLHGHLPGHKESTTLGWASSCRCNAPIVPCTVLDPFLGSGTTAAVARSLGRRFVGVEGSAEYVELARKRIEATTLALDERQEVTPAMTQLGLLEMASG